MTVYERENSEVRRETVEKGKAEVVYVVGCREVHSVGLRVGSIEVLITIDELKAAWNAAEESKRWVQRNYGYECPPPYCSDCPIPKMGRASGQRNF